MAELDPTLVLRTANQIRNVVRDAGDIMRMGPERALSAGMVQRNAGERIERALRLIDGLVAHCQGVGGPGTVLTPEPPAIIGPVIPPGGDTRRMYLLENPDVALQVAREAEQAKEQAERAAAPPEHSKSWDEAVAEAAQQILAKLMAPPVTSAPATPEQVAGYVAREQQLAAEPEPRFVPPADFGRTDLEDALIEDDLVDQLTGGVGTNTEAVVRRDLMSNTVPVGPDPSRPGWFPPGQIPPGVPIPPVPHTFVPFEGGHVTREELERIEQDAARADGRSYIRLPTTAPGVVTDDPAEYERLLAQRAVVVPAPEPRATESDLIPVEQEITRDVGDELDQAKAAANMDRGEKVAPCPECSMQAKAWVGLMGHAVAKHDFHGTMPQLKDWARGTGSSSSAA